MRVDLIGSYDQGTDVPIQTWLETFAPYVPLLQTLSWVVLIGVGLVVFRKQCYAFLEAVRLRVEHGSSLKAGPIKLGQDLRQLKHVKPALPDATKPKDLPRRKDSVVDWATERNALYEQSRGVFLAHVLEPSTETGQLYDIFVFLVRHKSNEFSDILHVEFFFGHYWDNQVFREEVRNGLIGVSTSAYGPFLCTCRVTFRDGFVAVLHRYIDFEMGRVFDLSSNKSLQRRAARK